MRQPPASSRKRILLGVLLLSISGLVFLLFHPSSPTYYGERPGGHYAATVSAVGVHPIRVPMPPIGMMPIKRLSPGNELERRRDRQQEMRNIRLNALAKAIDARVQEHNHRTALPVNPFGDTFRKSNVSNAFLPAIPPGLTMGEAARAKRLQAVSCLKNSQILFGPDGPRDSLRIVCAGMGRSGSTWQFNAVIAILQEAGVVPASKHGQLWSSFTELALTLGCKFSVIKVHQYHPYLLNTADYILTSHRDPRDSYSSLLQLSTQSYFGHYWGEYLRWAPFACLDMIYEEFFENEIREIQRLIEILPVSKSINATRVQSRIEKERLVASAAKGGVWNVKSGYSSRHVTDPEPGRWFKMLNNNYTTVGPTLMYVEGLTREWMMAHSYKLFFNDSANHNLTMPTAITLQVPQRCPLNNESHLMGATLPAATDFYLALRKITHVRGGVVTRRPRNPHLLQRLDLAAPTNNSSTSNTSGSNSTQPDAERRGRPWRPPV